MQLLSIQCYHLVALLLTALSITAHAQPTNYTANVANSSSPGQDNTLIGGHAGYNNSSGISNTFSGYYAGYTNTSGNQNTFLGSNAGYTNSMGGTNTFVGSSAGYANDTGGNNVFMGVNTGSFNTSGSGNTFLGRSAGVRNTTGSNNIVIGINAGYYNSTGSNNIIIGPNSGTAITDSDDNVLIGYNSQADDGVHNATAIGANSRVAISNAVILGNRANIGIGTSSPTARLEVVSETPDASGLRLTNLTTISPTIHATDQFLTVNEKGDVVKARYQLRINSPSEWSDKVFAPGYNLQPLSEVKTFIDANQHLPGVPSADQVAREGVDLVKMNATLLEKVEELTLYSIQLARRAQTMEQTHQQELQQVKAEVSELKRLVKRLIERN